MTVLAMVPEAHPAELVEDLAQETFLRAVRDVPDPATPETERARRELGKRIACAAEELGDDQRAAFLLADVHGFSIAEIAAAQAIPENTVKTRLFRARQHMRERLRTEDGDGSA
jgi:DNA-directed RNA polymerase specialized sigma24 family protein